MLSPNLRSLTAEDIFGPERAWTPILKERLWTALTRMGWSPPESQTDIKSRLEDKFIRPERWLFTKTGLQIAFSAYEGGSQAFTVEGGDRPLERAAAPGGRRLDTPRLRRPGPQPALVVALANRRAP